MDSFLSYTQLPHGIRMAVIARCLGGVPRCCLIDVVDVKFISRFGVSNLPSWGKNSTAAAAATTTTATTTATVTLIVVAGTMTVVSASKRGALFTIYSQ